MDILPLDSPDHIIIEKYRTDIQQAMNILDKLRKQNEMDSLFIVPNTLIHSSLVILDECTRTLKMFDQIIKKQDELIATLKSKLSTDSNSKNISNSILN